MDRKIDRKIFTHWVHVWAYHMHHFFLVAFRSGLGKPGATCAIVAYAGDQALARGCR